ncbi:3,4-dihydroxy-2-butanone-4-phosphate synthase [Leuconostoc mesenteroides]|uniref:3,4-dihydroxy-2-butanone-4-phosphate synthase n=1 Tax=Leuconostoc mesenteroides TaxID=1245 RepID=UPI0021A900C8|nr:3,4-dihydroxy-2-butanone-4-phosphate synthase [Leuconostoc mesenteroides]
MANVEEIVKYMKKGGLIILVDDEDRENEGDLVGIGAKMSPENVNFMVTHARGLLCTPVGDSITRRLGLTQMVANNTESNGNKVHFFG